MAKRVLEDGPYLRAKETGNENSDNGRSYEELLIYWFVLRLASMKVRYNIDLSPVAIEHHPPGQFIEDVKLSLQEFQAFYHAKSGEKLKWDRNLERDFRSQPDHVPEGGRYSMALYVRSLEKRKAMLSAKPADLSPMGIYVLDPAWMAARKSSVPRIRSHLLTLNNDYGTASLNAIWHQLRRAWNDLRELSLETKGVTAATLGEILSEANAASSGSVKAGDTGDRVPMFLVANQLRRIPGLWVAPADNSLKWAYGNLRGRIWLGPDHEGWNALYEMLSALSREQMTIDYFMNEM